MHAEKFAKSILSLRPTLEMYKTLGVSNDFIDEYDNKFNIKLINIDAHKSDLENLIFNYDLTKLNIGVIQFILPFNVNENLVAFANLELDHLVLDISDELIKYLSRNNTEPLYVISKNNSSFLDILYLIFESSQNDLFNIKNDPCAIANQLTNLSEMPNALGFYKMVLGCFT